MDAFGEACAALARTDEIMTSSSKHMPTRQAEAARQVAVAQVYATLWVGTLLSDIVNAKAYVVTCDRDKQ